MRLSNELRTFPARPAEIFVHSGRILLLFVLGGDPRGFELWRVEIQLTLAANRKRISLALFVAGDPPGI